MKHKILFLVFGLIPFWLNAQYLQPSASAIGYQSGSTPNYTIQQAFGELFTDSFTLDSLQLTEGFLQSEDDVWIGDSSNYFKIGAIPDYDVWQNVLTQFYVTADTLGTGVVFFIEYDTTLFTGVITMDSVKGRFKFMPTANDFQSFPITFHAKKDTSVISQEVLFNINAHLPAEGVAFGIEPAHDLPMGDDDQYIIKTVFDTTQANFNYTAGTGLNLVTIAGKEIVIEDGHPNNIFNNYNNQKTTRRFTVLAEKVIVRSQFYLPQCDVVIYARELVFEDPEGKSGEAFISTTPVTRTDASTTDGEAGLNAGSISLHIKDFSAPNAYRFFMDGGQGQKSISAEQGSHKSGDGGNGGDFKSTLNLLPFVSMNRGPAGEIENSASPGAPGLDGTFSLINYQMSWLKPLAMKAILLHAKDAYLYGHLGYTQGVCEEYFNYVDQYQSLTMEWDSLPSSIQGDLVQQQQEFQTIAQQIGSSKDFFGNPAGWVPMLSFEVSEQIFNDEIDRAINVMYLSYWIRNTNASIEQKQAAMATTVGKTKDMLEANLVAYTDVIEELPILESRSQEISAEVDATLDDIAMIEDEMIKSAEATVAWNHRPKKKSKWRKIGRIAGQVMQAIPVYQPALGAIGMGVETIANMDFNDPLGSAIQLVGVGATVYGTDWQTSYANLTPSLSQLANTTVPNLSQMVTDMQSFRRPISDLLGVVNEKAQETKLPAAEIEAELSKLMSENSAFKEIGIRIDSLKKVQVEFYTDFINAMQESARLIDEIQDGALAVDALDRSIVELNDRMIYARAMNYLNGMEQRSRNRLIKYHYYMAKAYEYRMVEAYPGELDLLQVFVEFQKFATNNADHVLTPEQFGALKAIYEEQLSSITESIIDYFNNPNVTQPSQSFTEYVFTPEEVEELNKLNSNESVFINLFESSKGIFTLGEEDIRINNIEFIVEYHNEGSSNLGNIDLYLYHSGESKIHMDGEIYVFRHYTDKTKNPLKWGLKMFADETYAINPSPASASLLHSLLENPQYDDLMLFSRPSAWADIELRKFDNTNPNTKFVIDNFKLKIDYDFRQNTSNSVVEIRVAETSSLKGVSLNEDATKVMSLVDISKKDLGDRTDGRGFILRPYTKNATQSVNMIAEEEFGSYHFDSWVVYGKGNMKSTPTVYRSSQISLSLGESQRAFLNYIYVEPDMETVQDTIFAVGAGEEKTITIRNTGNGVLNWDVYSDDDWVTFPSGTHGEGDTLATVEVLPNPEQEARTAYVVVAAPDAPNYFDTVWVVQEGFGDNVAIQFKQGWSGLSSFIEPNDPDIETVFESIAGEIEILQNMDGVYWPGQNINTLQNWDMTSGYAVKTHNSISLTIAGNRDYSKTIDLSSGWSMIPVLSSCDVDVNQIFSTLPWNLVLAKEVAGTKVYWPQFFINTIGNLEPGSAYYVYLLNNGSITFEDCDQLKSTVITSPSLPESIEPWGAISNSINTHAVAVPKELVHSSDLQQSDILGVFGPDGSFTGYTEIQDAEGNHIMVYGKDASDPKSKGIDNGAEMLFKVYRPGSGQIFDATVEFMDDLPQQGIFTTNGVSAFKSISLTEEGKSMIRVFPNPASDIIHVDCGTLENTLLRVYNMYGKLVMSKQLPVGSISIQTDGEFTPGVYNFEFSNESVNLVKRVVVR